MAAQAHQLQHALRILERGESVGAIQQVEHLLPVDLEHAHADAPCEATLLEHPVLVRARRLGRLVENTPRCHHIQPFRRHTAPPTVPTATLAEQREGLA